MMQPPEPKPNPMAVSDRPEAQTLTPATPKQASDILANSKTSF
jgi:hypothetical protein